MDAAEPTSEDGATGASPQRKQHQTDGGCDRDDNAEHGSLLSADDFMEDERCAPCSSDTVAPPVANTAVEDGNSCVAETLRNFGTFPSGTINDPSSSEASESVTNTVDAQLAAANATATASDLPASPVARATAQMDEGEDCTVSESCSGREGSATLTGNSVAVIGR